MLRSAKLILGAMILSSAIAPCPAFGGREPSAILGPTESEIATGRASDAKKVVVIDPGHGGSEKIGESSANNATGPLGAKEKDLTLEIGKEVAKILKQQGYTVHMTRSTDVNLGLADRAQVARDHRADAFVSIHFNGSDDSKIQGTETLFHPDATEISKKLARGVLRRAVAATGHRDRGAKPQDLGVLVPSRHFPTTASCLVEVSFLTDPSEELRLAKEDYKRRIAEAIAAGIADVIDPR